MEKTRKEKMNEFLEEYKNSDKIIYSMLEDYGIPKEIDNKFYNDSMHYGVWEDFRTACYEKGILYYRNENFQSFETTSKQPDSERMDTIKVYVNLIGDNIEAFLEDLIDFYKKEDIVTYSKISTKARADSLTIRLYNREDIEKVTKFVNEYEDQSLFGEINPFIFKNGNVGYLKDCELSGNRGISLIINYIKNRDDVEFNIDSIVDFMKKNSEEIKEEMYGDFDFDMHNRQYATEIIDDLYQSILLGFEGRDDINEFMQMVEKQDEKNGFFFYKNDYIDLKYVNGFDEKGYDINGFNRLGYNRYGYDKHGYNRKGVAIIVGLDGYDIDGYNREGYNEEGYNRNGYTEYGFDKNGINKETGTKYDKNGFDSKGIHRDTKQKFNQDGLDRDGLTDYIYGYDKWDRFLGRNREKILELFGINVEQVLSHNFDEEGYNEYGFDEYGYNRDGYDIYGYNRDGYDVEGYDENGFNEYDYDRDGYDKYGYNEDYYNKKGFGHYGGIHKDTGTKYDKEGYDKDGFNEEGYNRLGKTIEDYNDIGFDNYGFNKEGFDVNGYDREGFNKNGFNREGIHKITGTKYDEEGYDKYQFDSNGINKYTKTKMNKLGFNKEGINIKTLNKYNKKYEDIDGYNIKGYNKKGYDREGFDKEGYNILGYDKDGYDRFGYDKEGYNIEGYDRQGILKENNEKIREIAKLSQTSKKLDKKIEEAEMLKLEYEKINQKDKFKKLE